jgi:RNA polymerase-associated protein RTF1
MPELEREEIVLQRFEEVQRIKDMRNLDQMLRVHKGGAGDSSAKAAKRTFLSIFHGVFWTVSTDQHPGSGATNGKSPNLKIEKLRARRKAKQEAKRKAKEESNQVRGSPARSPSIVSESRGSSMRDRSLSPMDSEASDEEAEITKSEQKEKERKRKPLGIAAHNDESITIADISKVRLTRDTLSKYFLVPWFNEYVKGTANSLFSLHLVDDPH